VSTSEITRTTAQAIEVIEPRGDITAAQVTLAPAVAQINVKALNDSGNFVEGTALHRASERVTHSFTPGDPARLSLKTRGSVGITAGPGNRYAWDFSFHPDVALDLTIDAGMGDVNLDLRELTLTSVNVNAGMGAVTIKLPETGEFDVEVDGGMGTVVIEVPAGMGVRLQTDAAIVGHTIPAGYTHNNNRYTSPNYDTAKNRADIQVDLGVGSITIREISGK
jgi:predicted membrane protein